MAEREMLSNDEIDLIEIVKVIWSKRLFVGKVSSIFFVLGLIVAFTSKVEYEASCKLMPESQEVGTPDLGGLGGLAGLAGLNLNLGTNGSLTPELYPEIVESAPFIEILINTPVFFEKKDTLVSSFAYFSEIENPSFLDLLREYTLGFPGKMRKLFSSDNDEVLKDYNLVRFSKEEWDILEDYSERLRVSVDKKTGMIYVSTEMPDPVAAAMVTELLVNELTKRVTNYKLEKSSANLFFIEERFHEAKLDYELKSTKMASFTDRNRNLSNSTVQIDYKRLENELSIAFELYKGLATKLEQAKIKVKEETPVFTILEPARIPEGKSKPKRAFILLISILLGFLFASGYLIIRDFSTLGYFEKS